MKKMLFILAGLLLFNGASLQAGEGGFVIAKTDHGVSITVDGKPFANYVIDGANKPYLWPVYGPTGKQMTRAYPMQEVENEKGKQHDHPHHRGITFGHDSIGGNDWKTLSPEELKHLTGKETYAGGADTWCERKTFEDLSKDPKNALKAKQRLPMIGSVKHREFTALQADAQKAEIAEVCDYLDPAGKRFLTEERRLTFRATADTRSIDIDQDFIAGDGDVHFDDRKDGGLAIRVASSMAVDSRRGGHIVNSDGVMDADAWGKAAKWCDYYGPVDGEQLGIAFLNHPSSHRFPTHWHVRTYGLFSANPFGLHDFDSSQPDGTTHLKAGERLKLRHRILFHRGDAASAHIAEAWEAYAK